MVNLPAPTEVTMPRIRVGGVIGLFALFIVIVGLRTALFTVAPEEEGIVLRFGRFTGRIAEPGLHVKIPFGIDRVEKVAVKRQNKEEFGFRTVSAGVRTKYASTNLLNVSLMVTGDLNAAVVEWIVQYQVGNPTDYLFKVRQPIDTLRDAAESILREVVGDRTIDEVLTIGRQDIEVTALAKLQELMNRYEMGISIEQVVLQDVNPPDAVKASFNAVNQSQQEKEKLINQARAEYNKVIPRARGEAEQGIQEAEGYAIERVNQAEGDVARFNAMYAEYTKAPEVTRRRIYLETMREVIPKLGSKIIIDDDVRGILPHLQLPTQEAPRR